MAQRSRVPKFGNWDSEENVPYTAYFDKARKGRTTGSKIMNPNDPQENPAMFSDDSANPQAPPPRAKPEPVGVVARGAGRNREEGAARQFVDPPARNENVGRRVSSDQRNGGRGVSSGEALRGPAGRSVGSEQSIDRSPLHPHARVSGRGSGMSPSSEVKSSYESGHSTPGRLSRMRPPTRGDESLDKGAAVPKFGGWDENNPASADGYTHIFNKVREERQSGAGRVPDIRTDSSYNHARKPAPNGSPKACCFPWGGK